MERQKIKPVRLVIYRTGDKSARYAKRESIEVARSELLALEFKLVSRFPRREHWISACGLRALIVADSWAKRLERVGKTNL